MTLAGIKDGDIVQCDVRGERFHGFVKRDGMTSAGPREIAVATMCRGRVRIVTARQVICHWRKSKRGRS